MYSELFSAVSGWLIALGQNRPKSRTPRKKYIPKFSEFFFSAASGWLIALQQNHPKSRTLRKNNPQKCSELFSATSGWLIVLCQNCPKSRTLCKNTPNVLWIIFRGLRMTHTASAKPPKKLWKNTPQSALIYFLQPQDDQMIKVNPKPQTFPT